MSKCVCVCDFECDGGLPLFAIPLCFATAAASAAISVVILGSQHFPQHPRKTQSKMVDFPSNIFIIIMVYILYYIMLYTSCVQIYSRCDVNCVAHKRMWGARGRALRHKHAHTHIHIYIFNTHVSHICSIVWVVDDGFRNLSFRSESTSCCLS